MSILNRSFSSSAAALLIAAASALPSFPGMTSHAFAEEAKKPADTKQVEKDKPTLASAAKLPSETDKITEEKKDLGYDVVVLPPPADKEASYMGPLAEGFKEKYKNHILIFAFEKKGSKEAELQDKIFKEILPGLKDENGKSSERRITLIKIPRNTTNDKGNIIPDSGYDNAMEGLIAADVERFTKDGVNLLTRNGLPDTFIQTYINLNGKGYLRHATSISLASRKRTYEEIRDTVKGGISIVVSDSNAQLQRERDKVTSAKSADNTAGTVPVTAP